jgi:peroxiredoxin
MKLKDQLQHYKHTTRQKLADGKRRILEEHVRNLQSSGVASAAPKMGSPAPNFTLPDHEGKDWELAKALRSGPVVLKFYRGTWCPYCNIELRGYQLRLAEFRRRKAAFVAVSPERPDFSQSFITKEQIEYPVLSDFKNAVARRYGLQFTVDDALRNLMQEFGSNLAEKNGEQSWTLPVPGIFVISSAARIEYGFAEPDFTLRADPEEVLAVLDRL